METGSPLTRLVNFNPRKSNLIRDYFATKVLVPLQSNGANPHLPSSPYRTTKKRLNRIHQKVVRFRRLLVNFHPRKSNLVQKQISLGAYAFVTSERTTLTLATDKIPPQKPTSFAVVFLAKCLECISKQIQLTLYVTLRINFYSQYYNKGE